MKETKQTFCPICEPLCPMVAEIDANGRVVNLSQVSVTRVVVHRATRA